MHGTVNLEFTITISWVLPGTKRPITCPGNHSRREMQSLRKGNHSELTGRDVGKRAAFESAMDSGNVALRLQQFESAQANFTIAEKVSKGSNFRMLQARRMAFTKLVRVMQLTTGTASAGRANMFFVQKPP